MSVDGNDNCALNPDGSYKECTEIEWLNSPSDAQPTLPAQHPPSPTPVVQSRRSTRSDAHRTRYTQAILDIRAPTATPPPVSKKQKRKSAPEDSDEDVQPHQTSKTKNQVKKLKNAAKKGKNSSSTSQDTLAQRFLQPAGSVSAGSAPKQSTPLPLDAPSSSKASTPTLAPSEASHETNGASQDGVRTSDAVENEDGAGESSDEDLESVVEPQLKKRDQRADVLTVCDEIMVDGRKALRCKICHALKEKHPIEHRGLQTVFFGNLTTLRNHVERAGMGHFNIYEKRCTEQGIPINKCAIPAEEIRRREKSKNEGDPKMQSTLDGHFPLAEKDTYEWSKDGLMEMIVLFAVETNQPLSIVNKPSFRKLLHYQRGPKSTESDIPCRTKLTEEVAKRAQEIKDVTRLELNRAPGKLSFTFDGWTSKTMKPFMGVTVHYINHEWALQSALLSFEVLGGSHTGENQALHLVSIFKDYRIGRKVMVVTSDNVSVNDKTMNDMTDYFRIELQVEYDAVEQRGHCYGHAVPLGSGAIISTLMPKGAAKKDEEQLVKAIGDAKEEDEEHVQVMLKAARVSISVQECDDDDEVHVDTLLIRCRGFTAKVRKSPQVKTFLRGCCLRAGIKPLELIPYCPTRWQVWGLMLGRFIELRKGVDLFVDTADHSAEVPKVAKGQPKYSSYRITEKEWSLLERLYNVLKDAINIQQVFSSENNPTVWKVLPSFDQFIEKWRQYAADPEYKLLHLAIRNGIDTLEKYFEKATKSSAQIVNIYLNPCSKDEYFTSYWSEEGRKVAKETMDRIFDKYTSTSHDTRLAPSTSHGGESQLAVKTAASISGDGIDRYGSDRVRKAAEARRLREMQEPSVPREELARYLKDPLAEPDHEKNIIGWWKMNAGRYPVMALIARDYLAIQGSSVPCERLFSSAGLIDTKRRNKLKGTTFSAIETVKQHYKRARKHEKDPSLPTNYILLDRDESLLEPETED